MLTGRLVNNSSILRLKRAALKRTKTLKRDVETQQVTPPSRLFVIRQKVKALFTREFWEEAFERSNDETLVDNKLLSYAYLEVGMIETLGR